MSQKTTDKVVTQAYLDKKLDEVLDSKFDEKLKPYVTKDYLDKMFDEKLKPYVTKDYLDKKLSRYTEDIVEVMNEGFNAQGKILQDILEEMRGMKLDQATVGIRLNDHDVRIEKLEKSVN